MKTFVFAGICIAVSILLCAGCRDSAENAVGSDAAARIDAEKTRPVHAAPGRPESGSAVQQKQPADKPPSDASLSEEERALREEQVIDMMSARLDEIMDEYYENEDEDDIDRDTLLERLRQRLPADMRDNIPQEIMEEIDWWTE